MSRTAAGLRGFRHELFLYRSVEDLAEFVMPLARDEVAPCRASRTVAARR
jgi:hypothetical protein